MLAVYDGSIRLFNISDGSWTRLDCTEPSSIAFTNDDNYLLIGETKGKLRIYSIKTGKSETRLAVSQPIPEYFGFCLVNKIIVSPDGQKFICLLDNSRITIWNIKGFSKIKTLNGWGVYFNAVYLPKANRIITACYPNDLCFWDATTGKLLKTIEFYYNVFCMTESPDGKNVAVNAGGVDHIYDGSTGREIHRFDNMSGPATVISYSP